MAGARIVEQIRYGRRLDCGVVHHSCCVAPPPRVMMHGEIGGLRPQSPDVSQLQVGHPTTSCSYAPTSRTLTKGRNLLILEQLSVSSSLDHACLPYLAMTTVTGFEFMALSN